MSSGVKVRLEVRSSTQDENKGVHSSPGRRPSQDRGAELGTVREGMGPARRRRTVGEDLD